jgi:hypothetical protein
MPKRKNPPMLKLVLYYEMNQPEPKYITKAMVEDMHQALQIHVDHAISKNVTFADGKGARLVRVTRMV